MGNCFSTERAPPSGQWTPPPNVPQEKQVAHGRNDLLKEKSFSSSEASTAPTLAKSRRAQAKSGNKATLTTPREHVGEVVEQQDFTDDDNAEHQPATTRWPSSSDFSSATLAESYEDLAREDSREKAVISTETIKQEPVPNGRNPQPAAPDATAPTSSAPSSEARSTPQLTHIITTLPSSSCSQHSDALTTTVSASSSTPRTSINPTSTNQTTPPRSAILPNTSTTDTLWPATLHSTASITNNTTGTSKRRSQSPPLRIQNTATNEKRRSRISRMFSKRETEPNHPANLQLQDILASGTMGGIAEERAQEKMAAAAAARPVSKAGSDASRPSANAVEVSALTPTLEGRKWKEEGDNESLFCY